MGTRMNVRFAAFVASVMMTSAITACDSGPVAPVGRRPGVVLQGGGTTMSALAGTWQRTLVFFDDFGYLHSSETTWTFDANGGAVRTIVTTNHTLEASDTSVTLARWRLDGTTLVIDFTAPSPGTIVLDARVQGTTLLLAGQEYRKIP